LTSALGLKKKKNNYSKSIVNIYVSYNFTSKYSKNSYKIGTKNYIKNRTTATKVTTTKTTTAITTTTYCLGLVRFGNLKKRCIESEKQKCKQSKLGPSQSEYTVFHCPSSSESTF